MGFNFNFGIDFNNDPRFVDEICCPRNAHIFSAHEFFKTPDTIGRQHLVVHITEKRKLKTLLFNEFFLFCGRVGRYTQNLYVPFLKFMEFITESLSFGNSTRRIGLWEKPKNDFLAAAIL